MHHLLSHKTKILWKDLDFVETAPNMCLVDALQKPDYEDRLTNVVSKM